MSRNIIKQKQSSNTTSNRSDSIDQRIEVITNKSLFETVVVVDFVGNPDEYLSAVVKEPAASSGKNISAGLKSQFSNNVSIGSTGQNYRTFLTKGANQAIDRNLVDLMPRNSIVGINITNQKNMQNSDQLEVFFPFFSHMSLPVKSGEQVWIFYENIQGRKVGYWLSRKVGSNFVDDLNYTHIDRQAVISAVLTRNLGSSSSKLSSKRIDTIGNTFPNPSLGEGNIGTLTTQGYDDVILRSFSHDQIRGEFIGEAVPRFTKKCSDLVLQGSNNTLIAMTHESELNSGTIRLVAGRKNIKSVIKNSRGLASNFEHEEIDKLTALKGEFPDINEGIIDGTESASLVITELDGGTIRLGNASGAYIELKGNGDICLVPSTAGVIKLGGEDASLAMLSNMGTNAAGSVLGTPFATSMGGAVGAPGFGQFASKILVK